MARALKLAARGQGHVEPNPMVGCVIAQGNGTLGEGWHQKFGGPHAEIEALGAAGDRASGATMYVTLEPCCHQGKTPPCTDAIIRAGIERAVVAYGDPFPQICGKGIEALRAAGIQVDVGLLEQQARALNAPYLNLIETGRPWIIAKWAMTLDGKIATHTGDSKWISGEASRAVAHQIRGRVDAIVVGRGTVDADDPLLTARPPGSRIATRIVLDSRASLSTDSQLVRTVNEAPVLIVAGPDLLDTKRQQLTDAGCDVLVCDAASRGERLVQLLSELGKRRMTNVLVEGGGQVLGSLLDAGLIDEIHLFLAPKIVGGAAAPSPFAGDGVQSIAQAIQLRDLRIELLDQDVYIRGQRLHDA
ncbi:MAG: bifunctional diaminohydroxyphosphoribosylaminopyrimidine deaminase/5-amino-6-(5-phosphoribosylamino)uracil reductase RibD [Planctomycetes bacterium]|nr:bifunctional diaminohydroxyphosphoribosylaminopyrimidine deaminase/5-amino-6-(5-phosphoribosylamino)uracil reductase RibD [Planctomycetota bacterium]